ncbi:methyltransferase family protein [Terracoccus luteus]|uniref:Methyltransferase family protein n=1 Tax=Terracoccus luteus TaxID=53356 RepID=A0A495XWP1_9MICO|nr:methyltransferase domain-containing protein [Terracoccus luteus]RKT77565.1 methyltransferase family protein [Terracoccus luteus]
MNGSSTSSGYTHGHHESVLTSHRWRTAENSAAYLLPYLRPGQSLLDVGCGPATLTADLATRVAPGRVTATETGPAPLGLARDELRRRGITADVVVADVHALDLPDDAFDVVHAHQVLQHVADPVQALREMARVCRPGGVVAARDADYAGFTWFPRLPGLDEWLALYEAVARSNGGEPDAGRHLLSWAHAAGLADVEVSASVWCYAAPDDRGWWGRSWAQRILESDVATVALERGLANRADLQRISDAWLEWSEHPDGWFTVPHGEILVSPR